MSLAQSGVSVVGVGDAGDQPRFLGRGGTAYTNVALLSIDPAAECVDEQTQLELTRRAHRRWAKEMQRRWGLAATKIGDAIEEFVDVGVDRRLAGDLSQIRRGTERVTRRLDEELCRADGA